MFCPNTSSGWQKMINAWEDKSTDPVLPLTLESKHFCDHPMKNKHLIAYTNTLEGFSRVNESGIVDGFEANTLR